MKSKLANWIQCIFLLLMSTQLHTHNSSIQSMHKRIAASFKQCDAPTPPQSRVEDQSQKKNKPEDTQAQNHAPIKVGLISLPVNGTHLAHKCLELLLAPMGGWKPPKAKIGGQHLEGTKQHMAFFKDRNYKIIFMLRDPRDRIVSYAYKIKKFHPKLSRSMPDLMLSVIKDYGRTTYNYFTRTQQYKNMGDFSQYYDLYTPWFEYPDLLIVYFEKLVGPRAGGSRELQLEEIKKIAEFLEIDVSQEHIEHVADNVFGDSHSFRDPQIGRWKEFFNDDHKKAFKATKMAQFLIDFGYAEDLSW